MNSITSFNQIRVFLLVAKERSFSKAAALLRITQPAVSIQINQLENGLGVKLFDRIRRSVQLTAEGRMLLDKAKTIIDLLNNIDLEVANLKGLKGGTLVVGASTIPSAMILPAVIASFKKQHPETQISLKVANSDVVERWVIENEVDLAMVWGDPLSAQVCKEYFSKEELVLVLPPTHPLGAKRSISPQQIRDCHFLLPQSGKLKALIEAFFLDNGVPIKNHTLFGNSEAIKAAITSGLGVSIVARSAVERDARAGFMVTKRIHNLSLKSHVNIIYHQDKHFSPLARAFMEFLREQSAPRARRAQAAHSSA